jgi:hypothetical protein
MKLINAYTLELDEPAAAVSEVLNQLNLEKNALGFSVGFLTCSYDFVESGIVKAICDALPFDVVGCTTLTNANNDETGTMLLCLTVLTADDCRFVTAKANCFEENFAESVNVSARKAMSALEQPVKLALAFLPMFGPGGEIILATLDKALGGAPIFGTVACDSDTAAYSNTFVIHNGEYFKDSLSFLLVSGNVNPRFVVTSTSEQNLRKQQAVITSSEGCLLKKVNNITVKDYFESIGLATGKGVEGLSSVPFVVDYGAGTQLVARAIYGLNEEGAAICGGLMPEGGTLYIGRMDVEDILLTARTSLNSLLESNNLNGIIMFPCLGRNMILVMDPLEEADVVKNTIGDRLPWHLAYSGGECCPVYTKDGLIVNRFHNFTFIACAI